MAVQWRVTVRRPDGTRGPQIQDFIKLDLDARLMRAGDAPGTLSMDVLASHRAAAELMAPDAGLILEALPATGRVEWSGQIVDVQRTWASSTSQGDTLSVIAQDDDELLSGELAYPSPTVDVSTTGTSTQPSAYDVRTGAAESVWLGYVAANIGPAAGLSRRRYPQLIVPASLGRGAATKAQARFDDLMTLAQQILIPAGLACRVVHHDPGGLAVEVWAPAQPSGARYSVDAGNVRDLTYRQTAPAATEWIVAGRGDGTARVFSRRTDTGGWAARRRVRYLDARQATALDEMRQSLDEQAAEDVATEQVTWAAVPTGKGAVFGVGLHVGDLAQVSLPTRGTPLVDVVRRVEMRIEPGRMDRVVVTVGWPDPVPVPVTAARVRAQVAASVRS